MVFVTQAVSHVMVQQKLIARLAMQEQSRLVQLVESIRPVQVATVTKVIVSLYAPIQHSFQQTCV